MLTKYEAKPGSTRGMWKEDYLNRAIQAVTDGSSVCNASLKFGIPRKILEHRVKTGNSMKGPMGPSSTLGRENEERQEDATAWLSSDEG